MPTEEMSLARDMAVPIDCGANLAEILSNALPPDKRGHDKDKPLSDSSVSFSNANSAAPTRELVTRLFLWSFLKHEMNMNMSNRAIN